MVIAEIKPGVADKFSGPQIFESSDNEACDNCGSRNWKEGEKIFLHGEVIAWKASCRICGRNAEIIND